MRKTLLDALFGPLKDMATAKPRNNLGIEGYQIFINESHKVDSSRIRNKITYGSFLGKAQDWFYKKEMIEEFDNKRDVASYRSSKAEKLREESNKYLTELDDIVEDCSTKGLDLNLKISEVNKRLSPLIKDYNKIKVEYNTMKEKKITSANKVMNIFYSILRPNKIKKSVGFDQEKMDNLEYEMKLAKVEVDYDTKILKRNIKQSKGFLKKRNTAKREISKIVDFNSRTNEMKSFYEKYLDVNSNLVLNSSHTEIN